jgi:hypothetical protein
VDRPHQRTCMLSVACVEPQHSGSVRLATSVFGSQWRAGLGVPSFLTLFPRPAANAQLKK